MREAALDANMKKLRFLITNMAGPKKPMTFEGKQVHWRISAAGGLTNTFAIQSIGENVKLTLNSNVGFFKDAQGLLDCVERVIEQDNGPQRD